MMTNRDYFHDSKEAEIFQSLPIGVLQLDKTLRITWVSGQFLKLFKCERADIEGITIDKLISVKDRKGQAFFYSQLTQNKEKKVDTHVSLRIKDQDYLVHIRMSQNNSWVLVYIEDLLSYQNLTFRLLWDEEKFSNIVLSSGEGIAILDKDDRIIEFNRKFFEFMQFKSEFGVMISEPALAGKNIFDFLGNSFIGFKTGIHQNTNKHTIYRETIWYNNRCFEVQCNPTFIPIKGFAGNCIVFKDVTAQKMSEELTLRLNQQSHELEKKNLELEHALRELASNNEKLDALNQEKNYLINVVAHDLRSPLNNIIGLINIVTLAQDTFSDLQKECLNKVVETTIKLKNLTEKILDEGAIERETLNVDLQPVNLVKILNDVVNTYHPAALEKNIKISTNFSEAKIFIYADVNYTSLLYTNLLSNALKFSPIGSTVSLNLYIETGIVITEVIDSGPGFLPEEMKKLFTRFQKFSAKATANEKSHGLGLSIVKKYADIMNGNVTCENLQGKGAKFTVRFNLISEPAQA